MKEFFDEETSLKFRGYNSDDLMDGEFIKGYHPYVDELDDWSKDHGIQKYICSDMNLGAFLSLIAKHSTSYKSKLHYEHYLVFEDDKLVGTTLLTTNDLTFKDKIRNTKRYKDIRKDENPLLIIEYLATNPHLRNRGYGTRIVKAIENNEHIITNNQLTSGIATTIHTANIGSKKAFLKSNFICTPKKSFEGVKSEYRVFYFGKHKKSFESSFNIF